MNSIEINNHPATSGPILTPGIEGADPEDVIKMLIGAAMVVAEDSVKECYSGLRQLDPRTFSHVAGRWPQGEGWRYAASPGLNKLVDSLRAITRDIPEARRGTAPSIEGELVPTNPTVVLTDEVQLASAHRGAKP